jgi:hypothetical protein
MQNLYYIMKKEQEYLDDSLRHLQIADHITYVTFPLVEEKKLLLKIFEEISKSIDCLIFVILINEHKKNKLKISNNYQERIDAVIKASASYNIKKEEIKKIYEILDITKKHNDSAMEFLRKDKVVIMQDNLDTKTLDIKKIKEYLTLAKSLFIKINLVINN